MNQTNLAPTNERTVTLEDGRVVSNYSREYLEECEARAVLDMPSRDHRNRFLYGYVGFDGKRVKGVADVRGKAAADDLRERAEKLYYARKARAEAAAKTPGPQGDFFAA